MSDPQGQEPTNPQGQEPAGNGTSQAEHGAQTGGQEPPERYDAEYVKALRKSEAATRKRLSDLEARVKADEDAKLSEQERLTKRVSELEPLTESVREYEAAMAEMLEARLKGLTPEAQKAVESLPATDPLSRLRWLTANEALFTRQAAPKLDGGTGGGQRQNAPTLTAEEEAMARKMNISPERYAARKAEQKAAEKR